MKRKQSKVSTSLRGREVYVVKMRATEVNCEMFISYRRVKKYREDF